MAFVHIPAEQGSADWHTCRLGRLTGSRAADMLANPRKGSAESVSRKRYRTELVCERLTGQSAADTFTSGHLTRGHEQEPDARGAYEALTGDLVQTSGFLAHPDLMSGCSLDGHIGDFEGIVEIKCQLPHIHLDVLRSREVPGDYLKQITHNLWISSAAWADFISYSPHFPEPLQLFVKRVHRADVDLAAYELAARLFLAEVEAEQAEVLAMLEAA